MIHSNLYVTGQLEQTYIFKNGLLSYCAVITAVLPWLCFK